MRTFLKMTPSHFESFPALELELVVLFQTNAALRKAHSWKAIKWPSQTCASLKFASFRPKSTIKKKGGGHHFYIVSLSGAYQQKFELSREEALHRIDGQALGQLKGKGEWEKGIEFTFPAKNRDCSVRPSIDLCMYFCGFPACRHFPTRQSLCLCSIRAQVQEGASVLIPERKNRTHSRPSSPHDQKSEPFYLPVNFPFLFAADTKMAQLACAPSSSSLLSPESAATGQNGAAPTEYCVLLMGTWHKQPLFERLQSMADKFEQHIQYADTCYLTFHFDAESVVLELIDPGTEHTGAREMAIRKADAAILCYAAHSPGSFHTLAAIVDDFHCLEENRQPAALLLCNEDQLIEHSEPEEGDRTDGGSEGYGSASNSPPEEEVPMPLPSPRRHSMERIREAREEGQITQEQGEQLARQFGPDCQFRSISFASPEGLPELVQQLVDRAKQNRKGRQRSRSRSRTSTRKLSPIIPILRATSLKKLLTPSKSDAQQKKEAASKKENKGKRLSHPPCSEISSSVSSMNLTETGGGTERKRHSTFGNAFRVLLHPRERAKSQNKVAAAAIGKTESNHSMPISAEDSVQRTAFGVEVIPPTGEPCAEPFVFDPTRVNNFVGQNEANQNQQQESQATKAAEGTKSDNRLRTVSSPPSSKTCTIQ